MRAHTHTHTDTYARAHTRTPMRAHTHAMNAELSFPVFEAEQRTRLEEAAHSAAAPETIATMAAYAIGAL